MTSDIDRVRLSAPKFYVDCPACKGAGEITWNVSRDPQLEQSMPCHRCGGDGVVRVDQLDEDDVPLVAVA